MLDTIREAIISFATITIPQAVQMIGMSWVDFWTSGGPIMNGIILQAVIIGLIIALIRLFPHSAFATLMDVITEKVYDFFEEIIGKKASSTVKIYVVTLFFIIIISNLLGLVIDFVKLPFPIVEELFAIPTGNINFNLALSIVSIIIVLIIQRKSLGGGFTFFNEYVPLWGKGILTLERGNMSPGLYYPARVGIKIADIAISLFIGFLDIVGVAAKVISLAARLAGNMFSGPLLLAMLVGALVGLSQTYFNIDLPIVAVLLVYLQGLLVAVIQGFVFPLLVGIFIKMSYET